jgi:hypothetical protein
MLPAMWSVCWLVTLWQSISVGAAQSCLATCANSRASQATWDGCVGCDLTQHVETSPL